MENKSFNIWKDQRGTAAIFVFAVFLLNATMVSAQSLPSVDPDSVDASLISGTPVEEIITAANEGGLSGIQNLNALKPSVEEEVEEVAPREQSVSAPVPSVFSPDSIKNLELQGGLSSSPQIDSENPTVFKLAVKFFERVVFKNDTEFTKRPVFDEGMDVSGVPTFDKDTAGYAIIKKGNQSVAVDFSDSYEAQPIITATLSLQQYDDPAIRAEAEELLLISDVKYIVTKVTKKGFEIMMDRKADSDIPFSWHAFAVEKPRTYKKRGESVKSSVVSGPSGEEGAAESSASSGFIDAENPDQPSSN
jgi:hypothetical protein